MRLLGLGSYSGSTVTPGLVGFDIELAQQGSVGLGRAWRDDSGELRREAGLRRALAVTALPLP